MSEAEDYAAWIMRGAHTMHAELRAKDMDDEEIADFAAALFTVAFGKLQYRECVGKIGRFLYVVGTLLREDEVDAKAVAAEAVR